MSWRSHPTSGMKLTQLCRFGMCSLNMFVPWVAALFTALLLPHKGAVIEVTGTREEGAGTPLV